MKVNKTIHEDTDIQTEDSVSQKSMWERNKNN